MNVLSKKMAQKRRLRPYQPRRSWFDWFFRSALPLATALLIWGLFFQAALLWVQVKESEHEIVHLRTKLHDAEFMLVTCLNGGTPAYVEETLPSGQNVRVYVDCETKAKERIYQ